MNTPKEPGRSGTVAIIGASTALVAPAVGWLALAVAGKDGLFVWLAGAPLGIVGFLVGIIAGAVAVSRNRKHGKTALILSLVAVFTWCIEWGLGLMIGDPNLKF